MNKNIKLSWADKLVIFIFGSIILTLYYFTNTYLINLASMIIIFDGMVFLIGFSVMFSVAVTDRFNYNNATLQNYQILKLILLFIIALNAISLLTYQSNFLVANKVIIGSILVLFLILCFFILCYSPILHKIRINTKNPKTKPKKMKKVNLR